MAEKQITLKFIPEIEKESLRRMMDEFMQETSGSLSGVGKSRDEKGSFVVRGAEGQLRTSIEKLSQEIRNLASALRMPRPAGAGGGVGPSTGGGDTGPAEAPETPTTPEAPKNLIRRMLDSLPRQTKILFAGEVVRNLMNYDLVNSQAAAGAARINAPYIQAMQNQDAGFLYNTRYLEQANRSFGTSPVGSAVKDLVGSGLGFIAGQALTSMLGGLVGGPVGAAIGGLSGIAGALGAIRGGAGGLAEGLVTGGQSYKASAAAERNQIYENLMNANPFEQMALNYMRTNAPRNLMFQRAFGMSDADLMGFRNIANVGGFTMEAGMEAAQGILGAGGTSAGARRRAVSALEMARDYDVMNAPQLYGSLMQRMSPESADQALKKVLSEAIKSGFDASEKMKFMQAVVTMLSSAGATTGGMAGAVASEFAKTVPFASSAGISAAMNAEGILGQISSQSSGFGGLLQYNMMNSDKDFAKLTLRQRDRIAEIKYEDIDRMSPEELQDIANTMGVSVEEVREKLKKVKENTFASTATGQAMLDKAKKVAGSQYETSAFLRGIGVSQEDVTSMYRGFSAKTARDVVGFEKGMKLPFAEAAAAGAQATGIDILGRGAPASLQEKFEDIVGGVSSKTPLLASRKPTMERELELLSEEKKKRLGDLDEESKAALEMDQTKAMVGHLGKIEEYTKKMVELMGEGKTAEEAAAALNKPIHEEGYRPAGVKVGFDY